MSCEANNFKSPLSPFNRIYYFQVSLLLEILKPPLHWSVSGASVLPLGPKALGQGSFQVADQKENMRACMEELCVRLRHGESHSRWSKQWGKAQEQKGAFSRARPGLGGERLAK